MHRAFPIWHLLLLLGMVIAAFSGTGGYFYLGDPGPDGHFEVTLNEWSPTNEAQVGPVLTNYGPAVVSFDLTIGQIYRINPLAVAPLNQEGDIVLLATNQFYYRLNRVNTNCPADTNFPTRATNCFRASMGWQLATNFQTVYTNGAALTVTNIAPLWSMGYIPCRFHRANP